MAKRMMANEDPEIDSMGNPTPEEQAAIEEQMAKMKKKKKKKKGVPAFLPKWRGDMRMEEVAPGRPM